VIRRAALAACVATVLAGAHGVSGQSPAAPAAAAARPDYDIGYLGAPLPDPLMQHNKETYVSFGCAYCHGLTLIARGEAADLRLSALVDADVDGSTIVALLKSGIPQTPKLSPMPQFSDLSDQQLHAIARYIHYARGKAFFDEQCVGCHAQKPNSVPASARPPHDSALKNYTPSQVADLVAYLKAK
jgi:mono/diheme cytochrome c family protein